MKDGCSIKSFEQVKQFTSRIARANNTTPDARLIQYGNILLKGIRGQKFSESFVTAYIEAYLSATPKAKLLLTKANTLSEIKGIMLSPDNNLPEHLSINSLNSLRKIPGFESTSKMVTTIRENNTSLGTVGIASNYNIKRRVSKTSKSEIGTKARIIEFSTYDMSKAGEMLHKRSDRIALTKDIDPSSPDMWGGFLKTYFPNMSGISKKFTEKVTNEINAVLLDSKAGSGKGFRTDVHNELAALKKSISDRARSIARNNKYPDGDFEHNLTINKNNFQELYFEEVFSAEFDFIITSIAGTIAISDDLTKQHNNVVRGFIDEISGESLPDLTVGKRIVDNLMTKVPPMGGDIDIIYELNENIDKVIHTVPMSTAQFTRIFASEFDTAFKTAFATYAIDSGKLTKMQSGDLVRYRKNTHTAVTKNTSIENSFKDLLYTISSHEPTAKLFEDILNKITPEERISTFLEVEVAPLYNDIKEELAPNDIELLPNKFYRTEADGILHYRDNRGNSKELTPLSRYEYNTSNKRNVSSIDSFISPIESSSQFVNSIFPMLRSVDIEGDEIVLGRRLTISDYLVIAPRLIDAGKTEESFRETLRKMGGENNDKTDKARIARSLYYYVFNDKDEKGVRSIYTAGNKGKEVSGGNFNVDVITSLTTALTNKDNVRYIRQAEGRITTTKKLSEGTDSIIVNEGFAGLLVDDGYTKKHLAKLITSTKTSIRIPLTSGILTNINDFKTLDGRDGTPGVGELAKALGLEETFDDIVNAFTEAYEAKEAEQAIVDTMKGLVLIAAANKKEKKQRYKLDPKTEADAFDQQDFAIIAPSEELIGRNQGIISTIFGVDSNKNIRIAGKSYPSTTTPNRDTHLRTQIKYTNHYTKNVNRGTDLSYNPFLEDTPIDQGIIDEEGNKVYYSKHSAIPRAKLGDTLLKTPTIKEGESIGMSDWDLKIRVEHAMLAGFIQGPKQIGREFFVQPTNYSDKSNATLHEVFVEENLLSTNEGVKDKLIEAYISYQKNKYNELQRVTFQSLREVVVGDFRRIEGTLEGDKKRIKALNELRTWLLTPANIEKGGDMTRDVNKLLGRIKIDPDTLQYSDADMDKHADYITFKNEPDTLYLKPHVGIRAEAFSNKDTAKKIVEDYLVENRTNITKGLEVDSRNIKTHLKQANSNSGDNIIQDTDEFYDRFFLINGIYGNALKVLTLGDESYFGTFYDTKEGAKNGTNAYTKDQYYSLVDSGVRSVFEEVHIMLQYQFKRAQSELTRGTSYMQKTTLVGMKRDSHKDNILQHADRFITSSGPKYDFKALKNKTLDELHGIGVLAEFTNGSVKKDLPNKGILMKINFGDDVIFYNSTEGLNNLINSTTDPEKRAAFKAINEIMPDIIDISNLKMIKNSSDSIPVEVTSSHIEHDVYDNRLTVKKIERHYKALKNSKLVTMPDFIPSITVTDPSSYVNILSEMNKNQDNSDAIQFMHPLLSRMMQHGRGNKIGAFNTDNQEALKTVTTTFEYNKFRQVLQKKSVQNAFTTEQMRKLGSIELYNVFKKMNTAIQFKNPNMSYYDSAINLTRSITAKNMHELFEQLGGFSHDPNLSPGKADAAADAVWDTIVEIMREHPENAFDFVGYINVPSNQKTGHKKFNKYNEVFSTSENTIEPVIDYTGNEFTFEVLTKAHDSDVSGNLHRGATISLLSQLVNATSFGGLSNVTSQSLQNAMAGKMELNRYKLGNDMADVGESVQEEHGGAPIYNKIINNLRIGDFSTKQYEKVPGQLEAFELVLRKSIIEMASLAFNEKVDSLLIKKIIEGEKNAQGETETMFSLDTPAVQNKVMATLRAAYFKDTVKMKMSGFIGVVSATHKTVNIYSLPNNLDGSPRRVGRAGFIDGALKLNAEQLKYFEGDVVTLSDIKDDNQIDSVIKGMIPYDSIELNGKIVKAGTRENIFRLLSNKENTIRVVRTPDVVVDPSITDDNYDSIKDNDLVVLTHNKSPQVVFKWYLEEMIADNKIVLEDLIKNGTIAKDLTENYSLRWYDVYRDAGDGTIENLKDTDAYRNYYRSILTKQPKDQVDKAKALLLIETQMKNDDDTSKWEMTHPEVVTPTFNASAFGIEKGTSLYEIIYYGNSNDVSIATREWFKDNYYTGKTYAPMLPGTTHYTEQVLRIYARNIARENQPYAKEIYDHLSRTEKGDTISEAGLAWVTAKLKSARVEHMNILAENFITSLRVVMTRIPGQSKQSGFTGQVVEFMDSQGNATFAPTEHLVNTGGDLDIDTLSVLTQTIDKYGKIYKVEKYFEGGKGFDYDALFEDYKEEIKSTETHVITSVSEYRRTSNLFIERREADLAEAIKEGNTKKIDDLRLKLNRAKNTRISREEVAKIISGYKRKIHARYENIISNVISGSIFESLSNVNAAMEINTPVSLSLFGPILEKIREEEATPDFSDANITMSGENYMPNLYYEELNAQGKEGIGMYANVLKINSGIQSSKINYDNYYKDVFQEGDLHPFYFKNDLVFNKRIKTKDGFDFKTVEKTRTGFADIDRFKIFDAVESSKDVQGPLKQLLEGGKKFDKDAVSTLVKLVEGELKSTLENMSEDGVLEYTEDVRIMFADKVESLLGIELTKGVRNSKNPLKAFTKHLKAYPAKVEKAYVNILTKQLSNDMQSQFLTAATDNAKELILGKIRANNITNPVISTLMLLGYSPDTIIDFLHDEAVTALLVEFYAKKGRLETTYLTTSSIKKLKIKYPADSNQDAITSLKKILDISDSINKFRALRSLNENSEIESFKLDKILGNLDADALYQAIILDDAKGKGVNPNILLRLAEKEKAQKPKSKEAGFRERAARKVFDPDVMIFLHPQSRALFKSVYETEKYRMPHLFKTNAILKAITGKDNKTEKAYKGANSYVNRLKIEKFLQQKGQDGKTRSGTVVEQEGVNNYSYSEVNLAFPDDRAEFVKNFGPYLTQQIRLYKEFKGGSYSNAALDSMVFTRSFLSTDPILSIPKLKHANVDKIEAAVIHQGIEELKTVTPKSRLDQLRKEGKLEDVERLTKLDNLKRELYKNLSSYALIVSNGEIKKGSMIELFTEVNESLGIFLDTLSNEDYNKFIPETDVSKDIITNNVKTRATHELIGKRKRAKAGAEDHGVDIAEQYDVDDKESLQEAMNLLGERSNEDQEDLKSYSRAKLLLDKSITKPQITSTHTRGQVYKLPAKLMERELFFGTAPTLPAFRIFDAYANEALPVTTIAEIIEDDAFAYVPKNLQEDLRKMGKQVGFTADYGGEDVRILAYVGKSKISTTKDTEAFKNIRYEKYMVLYKGSLIAIPGAVLMAQNPTLFLKGHLIQNISGRNLRRHRLYNVGMLENEKVMNFLNDQFETVSMDVQVSKKISTIFDNDKKAMLEDPIISLEAPVIDGAADVIIKVKNISDKWSVDDSYKKYHDAKNIHPAQAGSRRILIPAFKVGVTKDNNPLNTTSFTDMQQQIVNIINTIDNMDDEAIFYGILNNGLSSETEQATVGGMDVFNNLLKKLGVSRKAGENKGTFFNDTFAFNITTTPGGLERIDITRNKKNVKILMNSLTKFEEAHLEVKTVNKRPQLVVKGLGKEGSSQSNILVNSKLLRKGFINQKHAVSKIKVKGRELDTIVYKVGNSGNLFKDYSMVVEFPTKTKELGYVVAKAGKLVLGDTGVQLNVSEGEYNNTLKSVVTSLKDSDWVDKVC